MTELYVEYLPLADIEADDRNPKAHRLDLIDGSFDEFGYTEPVVLDERTGKLLAGHGRTEQLALRQATGAEAPDGIRVEADGSWSVPVTRGVQTRDDDQAAAYLVAANRISEVGGWDNRALMTLLASIPSPDLVETTGFDMLWLEAMDAKLNPSPPDLFPILDPSQLSIEHTCPNCGYEWSGNSTPTRTGDGTTVGTDD